MFPYSRVKRLGVYVNPDGYAVDSMEHITSRVIDTLDNRTTSFLFGNGNTKINLTESEKFSFKLRKV